MKRTSFLAIIVLLCILTCNYSAAAQRRDTLKYSSRKPTNYYFGTQWLDNTALARLPHPVVGDLEGYYSSVNYPYPFPATQQTNSHLEIAKRFITEPNDTIRIVGVAFSYFVNYYKKEADNKDWLAEEGITWTKNDYIPEHISILEAGSMTPLTDQSYGIFDQWDTAQIYQHMFMTSPVSVFDWCDADHIPRYIYMREVMFDHPVVVHDSFYVCLTNLNNEAICIEGGTSAWPHVTKPQIQFQTTAFFPEGYNQGVDIRQYTLSSRTPYPVDHTCRASPDPPIQSTAYLKWDHHDLLCGNMYLWTFPIIDTTFNRPPDTTTYDTTHFDPLCPYRMNGIELTNLGYRSIMVQYTPDPSHFTAYQLSYCPADSLPDSGIIIDNPSTHQVLSDLDTTTYQMLYMRGLCPSGAWSAWSSGIRFRPTRGLPPTAADKADPHSISILPNPASDRVLVVTHSPITSLQVFNIEGRQVEARTPHTPSTSLNTSAYPVGVYFLRITTSEGTAIRKLTVAR
ncbi:MAG: T9SS type A sorting domain-containing protein [Bacteroidales bacterium]|nr:T9SS type A sorting domain-containing protein [Bacteroidales bacterium]